MKDIYTIENTVTEDARCAVTVQLNADHPIYQAHFPGYPITPGAVLFGIAVRLVAMQWDEPKDVQEVKNVKFLQPHHPQEHPHLTFSYEINTSTVNVVISDGETTFSKMTLIF